ncbi:serine protease, partial [Amycolatopsis sp. H20-H5]
MLALTFAIAAALALAVQPASAGPAIIGGHDADQPYPFTVSLHTASGKLFCAGSLIAPTWVVTAGHCVQGKSAAVLSVRVGSNDSTAGGETAQPAELLVNPGFTTSGAGGDIALVRLASPVKAAPITLGTSAAPGTATRLLGWGQTCPTQNCGQPPTTLQQLDTQIVDGSRCTAAFDGKVELCTDNPGGKSGSCYG